MPSGVVSDVLHKIPLFQEMNETERRQMADIALIKEFAAGDVILKQGESSQNLWVVLEGTCQVIRDVQLQNNHTESVRLAELEAYAHFGEMSFFHRAAHSANVVAKTAVKVLCIPHGEYHDLVLDGVSGAYKLAYNVVDGLAERLRRMDQWVAELLTEHPAGQSQVPEWLNFREKLFNRWNL